jgi:hypothetical protein
MSQWNVHNTRFVVLASGVSTAASAAIAGRVDRALDLAGMAL